MLARHYFNNVLYTPWPFYITSSLSILVITFLLSINFYSFVNIYIVLIILFIVLFYISSWSFEMIYESKFLGRYNIKVTSTLIYGFLLFIASEIMLFGSFFWTFFDRYFHLSSFTGLWYTVVVAESFDSLSTPIVATLILVTSGYTYNTAYYFLKGRMAEGFLLFSLITILLGIIFLVIQYNEYINLLGSITNTVALSIFYLVTGFHGAHVFLGIVLIICTEIQIDLYDISTGNTLMISIALMYWHFVDIIWLVVLLLLYSTHSFDLYSYRTFFYY